MTVYVDDAVHPFGRMLMCHMASPDLDELHAMADQIGVARKWFQDPRTMTKVSRPHYDIAKSKRALAIAAGAVAIDRYQMVAISNVAYWRLHSPETIAAFAGHPRADPLRVFRGKDGRPGHPELPRLEVWLAEQMAGPAQPSLL